MNNSQREYKSYSSGFNDRTKSFSKVDTFQLIVPFGN
jgi:hypothetical protein